MKKLIKMPSGSYGYKGLTGDSNTNVTALALQARVIAEVGRILDVAARQSNACRDAADQLAYLHGELEAGHIPAYDVASALLVLRTGESSACSLA